MSRRLKGANAPQWLRWAAVLLLGIAVLWGQRKLGLDLNPGSGPEAAANADAGNGDRLIQQLFEDKRSDEVVTIEGIIDRVLEDDKEGSRHQRFIVRLASRRTLLVAHNIDLADRVPLERGDRVQVRGEYEWNEQGGVMHWTHRDPRGNHPGGWVEFEGTRYQ